MTSVHLCTFALGELVLGLDLHEIQEILQTQRLTRVPRAAACIEGLINLRGQIVLAVDLRRALGLPGAAQGAAMNVVLRDRGVCLLVDDVGDVIEVDGDHLKATPENLQRNLARVTREVAQLDDGLVLRVDPDAVLAHALGGRALQTTRVGAAERLA